MELILLQPLKTSEKTLNVSLIERKFQLTPDDERAIIHEGDGQYAGLVVKQPLTAAQSEQLQLAPSHLSFKLNAYMRNPAKSGEVQHETRTLQFWFSTLSDKERIDCSNTFLRSLFKTDNFPKDYFMFLLRTMLIFKELKPIYLLRIDIEKIGEPQAPSPPLSLKDPKQYAAIISGKILEYLERAFPNMVSVDELARLTETDQSIIYEFLRDLFNQNLVKYFDNGNSWMRNIINSQDDQTHDVIMIQQYPNVAYEDQPTIAIITVNYYEKLAMDSMMTNKITFVRHKTDGESNVYTIGLIGQHRIVTTKLPMQIGRDTRSAKISSGSSTTRLLGFFQKIQHVLVVGCAGGVPHYSDVTKHPRRGDIVISYPETSGKAASSGAPAASSSINEDFVYAHFDVETKTTPLLDTSSSSSSSQTKLTHKVWMPSDSTLYKIVNNIRKSYDPKSSFLYPWENYLSQAIKSLTSTELDWSRPKEDKLYFSLGEKNFVEAEHPTTMGGEICVRNQLGYPHLRFGKIGGGDSVVKDSTLRNTVSENFDIVCFDNDIDQVMESIEGNRYNSFIVIKSIADYTDGTTTKEWQPYSSLCAAAFAKTIINAITPSVD